MWNPNLDANIREAGGAKLLLSRRRMEMLGTAQRELRPTEPIRNFQLISVGKFLINEPRYLVCYEAIGFFAVQELDPMLHSTRRPVREDS